MRRNNNPLVLFIIFVLLMIKSFIVAAVRGWSLSANEIALLAAIDVVFMLLIAAVLSKTHAVSNLDTD